MKIYTKTGDKGTTGLIGGNRVPKNANRLCAYGTSDELNAFIGLLRAQNLSTDDDAVLNVIQNKLFNLGAFLATPLSGQAPTNVKDSDVQFLEERIDEWSELLPNEHAFILPGGNQKVALCHVCRTIARRLERELVDLFSTNEMEENISKSEKWAMEEAISLAFVNRLSDFLFILAKKMAKMDNCSIFLWEKE